MSQLSWANGKSFRRHIRCFCPRNSSKINYARRIYVTEWEIAKRHAVRRWNRISENVQCPSLSGSFSSLFHFAAREIPVNFFFSFPGRSSLLPVSLLSSSTPPTHFSEQGAFFFSFFSSRPRVRPSFSLKFLLANFLNLRKSKLPIFGLTVFFRLFGFWKLFFLCFQAARFFSLIVRFAYIQRTTLCFFFFHITYFFLFFFLRGNKTEMKDLILFYLKPRAFLFFLPSLKIIKK